MWYNYLMTAATTEAKDLEIVANAIARNETSTCHNAPLASEGVDLFCSICFSDTDEFGYNDGATT